MKAVIEVDVPEYQIGQEVSVYFKDTMCVKSVCKKIPSNEDEIVARLEKLKGNTGCDYNRNSIINDCIRELKGGKQK